LKINTSYFKNETQRDKLVENSKSKDSNVDMFTEMTVIL